jgi:hypothetical protein
MMTLQDFAKTLLQELTAQLQGGCSTCGRTLDEPLDENERCCGCSDARALIEQAKSFWVPASMLESEKDALRAMARAAKSGKHGDVRLTRWDAKLPDEWLGTTMLRVIAWRGHRDDDVHLVAIRTRQADADEFCAEAARFFADLVEAQRVVLHSPDGGQERLR